MLFAIGTKVRLKHTGDLGEVAALLSDGMVNVRLLHDNMEIPIFQDDLIRVEDEFKKSTKAKIVEGKKEKIMPDPHLPQAAHQYKILKSIGIQLAFDPVKKTDGSTESFNIYLINDTRYDTIFTLTIDLLDHTPKVINGKLNSVSFQQVGMLSFDNLNDAPIFELECRQLTTAGTGPKLLKEIRIKAKQFFKNVTTAPLLDKPVHLYKVFEHFDTEQKEEQGEDLKSYTKRNIEEASQQEEKKTFIPVDHINLKAVAEFTNELDLHIENLTNDYDKLDNAQIMRIQLIHFNDYIKEAYRLGVSSVFIIHGVGKGKLKEEIAKNLRKNTFVKSFVNEYNPRYGYGATEVVFL